MNTDEEKRTAKENSESGHDGPGDPMELIPQDTRSQTAESELPKPTPGWLGRIKRPIIALVLTILIPGLGQLYNRQLKKAILFAGTVPALLFATAGLNLLHHFSGYALWVLLMVGLSLWFPIDAFRGAWKQQARRTAIARAWAGYALFSVLAIFNFYAGVSNLWLDRALGVKALVIAAESMAPTLQTGDRLIGDMHAYSARSPERGEVVLFEQSGQPTLYVKRVIAVASDIIEIGERGVWVNGKKLDEPYLETTNSKPTEFGPEKIPAGEFFVMGDNRENSYDSRYFGSIKGAQIKGRALFIYWSRDTTRIGKEIQ